MKKLVVAMLCLAFVACTPNSVENETEQFGIDKDKVETPTTRGN